MANAQYNVLGIVQPVTDSSLDVIGQRLAERYEYTPYGERQVYSHGWILEDLNGDGVVTGIDYVVWGNAQSGNLPHDIADVDGDGIVEASDDAIIVDAVYNGFAVPQNDPLVLTATSGTHRSTHTHGGGAGIPLNTLGHQGLSHDEETGLVYNRARHLHPQMGRFIQRDPLGYIDGMSTYLYVLANPLKYRDPLGLAHSVHQGFLQALANGSWATANAIMKAANGGKLWTAAFATSVASRLSINLGPALNQAQRAWHIIRPPHNWCKLVNIPQNTYANATANFPRIQQYITQAWNNGSIIARGQAPNQPSNVYIVTKEAIINGEKVVVYARVVTGSNPSVTITNALVR